jgi:hypothetical protein
MQQPDALIDVLTGIEEQLEELRYAILLSAASKR